MSQAEPLDPAEWHLPPRTNQPHDAPTPEALVEAVRRYLADDLMPRSDGADRWLLRVAANALAIAGRELAMRDQHVRRHEQRLASLGVATEAELSAAIRAGTLDDRRDEVRAALTAMVADKLAVANPGHAGQSTAPASGADTLSS